MGTSCLPDETVSFLSLPLLLLPGARTPGQMYLVMEVSHQVPQPQKGGERECASLPRLLGNLSHTPTIVPKKMLP